MMTLDGLKATSIEQIRVMYREATGVRGAQVYRLSKADMMDAIIMMDAIVKKQPKIDHSEPTPPEGEPINNPDHLEMPVWSTQDGADGKKPVNGDGVQWPNSKVMPVTPVAPAPAGDLAAMIAGAIQPFIQSQSQALDPLQVMDICNGLVTNAVQDLTRLINDLVDETKTGVMDWARGYVDQAMAQAVKPIEITQWDGTKIDCGLQHHLFETILKIARRRRNVLLVGPAGGGKTHMGSAIAKALELPFWPMSVGPQSTKTDIVGFIDAHGIYRDTPFRQAFKNGGVFLLDELDAGNAGVLTLLNAALSNGHMSFPDAVIEKHEDFICIAAANTYGRGADRQYVGRNQLDAATLDRFRVLDFDYDEKLELALAGNAEWTRRVQKYRARAWELKERVVISPRASIGGAEDLADGFSLEDAEAMNIWKGISPDIIRKIKGN